MVKAIMVMIDTWVTHSLITVRKEQPIAPNGQGYSFQSKNISIGMTEKNDQKQLLYAIEQWWHF